MALAVAGRSTNAVFAVLVLLLIGVRCRPALMRFVIGGLLVRVVFLAFSKWQYGQFLQQYYEPSRFADPPWYGFGESLLVNLVSPSRGLLWFDPVIVPAVLCMVRTARRRLLGPTDLLMGAAMPGQLLVIAKYGSTGGFTSGPRLMIDILPMLFVLAAPAVRGLRPAGGRGPESPEESGGRSGHGADPVVGAGRPRRRPVKGRGVLEFRSGVGGRGAEPRVGSRGRLVPPPAVCSPKRVCTRS